MLKQRIITALIAIVALLLVLFFVPPAVAELFVALVALAGAWEWSAFLKPRNQLVRIAFVALVGLAIAALALLWPDSTGIVLRLAIGWWLAALIWAFFFPTPIPLALRWICGVLVLVPLYTALVTLYNVSPYLLLFALVIVWAADVGAYFSGKQFGRVKLAPSISPGKTWEGVLGGLLLVAILSAVGNHWIGTNLAVLVPFCVGVAGISIVGDLTVSMFKRTSGIKDSGKLFPGHGGVLDRVDSVSAASPVFALGIGWMGLA
ncbi:MAG: phosphatidate cytidylyltransferase [Pseudomonadota bacterium]